MAQTPGDKRTLFYLANALKGLGRFDEAILRYSAYLELGGNFHTERYTAAQELASCHLMRQEWALAIDAAFGALRIDPRYAEPHCVLGDAYGALGDLEKAKHW